MATGRKSPCQVEPRLWLSSLTAGIASVNTIPTWRPPMRMMDPLQWSVMRRNGGAVPLSRNSSKPLMRYQPPHGQMWAMQELGLTWPGGGGPKQRAHLMKRPYMAPLGCWNCSSDYKLICSFATLIFCAHRSLLYGPPSIQRDNIHELPCFKGNLLDKFNVLAPVAEWLHGH